MPSVTSIFYFSEKLDLMPFRKRHRRHIRRKIVRRCNMVLGDQCIKISNILSICIFVNFVVAIIK